MAADGTLRVVALVSGGKDSFYSILHCLANGHRVVALANLYPPPGAAGGTPTSEAEPEDEPRAQGDSTISNATVSISPGKDAGSRHQHQLGSAKVPTSGNSRDNEDEDEETDLNSFMYQTVGHQVIPLYAQATGLPLFRQAILGTAINHGISYQDPDGRHHQEEDETESLVPLLRAVLKDYPEVNALCTGAILSTYQRTRIESVALRLGLVPLAYLWQFPELPLPSLLAAVQGGSSGKDDAQLLRDMAAAGLEARVVKVASAGLGEEFLWENVASEAGVSRIQRSLRRFGGGGRGSVLGEGGEFETLVVDGPLALFRGRIVVGDGDWKVVREGGGSAWLSIRDAKVEMKAEPQVLSEGTESVRIPDLLDLRFEDILKRLRDKNNAIAGYGYTRLSQTSPSPLSPPILPKSEFTSCGSHDWYFVGTSGDVEEQTTQVVDEIRHRLHEHSLPATAITNSVIVLRRMADFPTVNRLYGALFREPNPPARVTISCGNLLIPSSADIAVLLAVQPSLKTRPDWRRGLHVQSRSYWAPANIGPYSQAIAYPLVDEGRSNNEGSGSDSPLAVSIAGQIPLVPASMTLPLQKSDCINTPLQITLALQHLWRVGVEMQVQWWSSAVAYFPHSSDPDDMRCKALLAATAWEAAHSRPSPADTEDSGLDPWDRKYNPMYMTYGDGGDAVADRPTLPHWEVLKDFDADAEEENELQSGPLPFVFSAEVEELPRAAGVEWHAHLGLANLSAGSVQLYSVISAGGLDADPDLHHTIVASPACDIFVQTVAIYRKDDAAKVSSLTFEHAVQRSALAVRKSLAGLLASSDASSLLERKDNIAVGADVKSKLTYVDLEPLGLAQGTGTFVLESGAAIPCRSLWDSSGARLGMVSIFETRWARIK
ncbi:adenine nucleotide alpha hydrolases-like protein [Hypoxylon sp. NC1633]|nr:adenine nucleotide alpha hydrolases-like protein [Hypoxylon sp. NC1633]